VRAGGVLAAAVAAEELRGDWVSVWMHGAAAVWLGWAQLDLGGGLTADVPAGAAPGEYRLAVKRRDGALVGWDRFTVTEPPGTGGGPETPGEPSTPTPAPVAPPQECLPAVTLDRGHVDAFAVSAANGTAVLQLLEDVTGHRVLREAETVLMRVPESAYAGIAGQPGGPAGYVLPLTQNPGLVWPGWDTNRTAASGYSSVAINVTGVSGPGQVYLSTRTPFGELRPVLTHGGYALPGTIHESTPAHTHAQWVFTQPGVYVLTAHAVATNPSTGAGLATASHDYVFQVGDVPLGDVFCGLSAHGAGASAMVDAAVTQAGLEAVAAEQAAAAERDRRSSRERDRADGRAAQGEAAALASLGAGASPAVVWSIVGGGVLAIGGIAGATVWLLRRVDAEPGG
jgi:surface-anchored protein